MNQTSASSNGVRYWNGELLFANQPEEGRRVYYVALDKETLLSQGVIEGHSEGHAPEGAVKLVFNQLRIRQVDFPRFLKAMRAERARVIHCRGLPYTGDPIPDPDPKNPTGATEPRPPSSEATTS